MKTLGKKSNPGMPRRKGASLLMVTVIVTGLAMVTSAILPQLTAQSRQAQDAVLLAKALQAAEAGIDYEIYWMTHGMTPHDMSGTNGSNNGYEGECPAGSGSKFRVGVVREDPGRVMVIRSIGIVGEISRTLEAKVKPASPPFALYGVSPAANSVNLRGTADIGGRAGTNGTWDAGSNTTLNEGPLLVAGPSAKVNNGNATITNPVEEPVRTWEFPVQWPTADGIANSISGSTQGVRYFKSNNDNNAAITGGNRGVFYVFRTALGVTLEVPFLLGNSTQLTRSGIKAPNVAGYSLVAVKFYPGNYYFTELSLGPGSPPILIDNRPTANGAAVNFWLDTSGSNDPKHQISPQIDLADRNYPGRFWIYVASTGGFRIAGNDQPFYANVYYYNTTNSGSPYGHIDVDSGSVLQGSLIAYTLDIGGGANIILPPNAGEDPAYNGPLNFIKVVSWGEVR